MAGMTHEGNHALEGLLCAEAWSRELGDILQGVDGEMQVSKRRRRRALLQDGKHSPNTQFDMGLLQQTSDATEPCTESISCAPEWDEVAHGVVSIYAINTRIRALGLCTGACSPTAAWLHDMRSAGGAWPP